VQPPKKVAVEAGGPATADLRSKLLKGVKLKKQE
jgi:hypothetical protein